MAFYSMPLTIAAMTPAPNASAGMTQSSSAYTTLVPNRFGNFWRG
jgi:hypothetical protein